MGFILRVMGLGDKHVISQAYKVINKKQLSSE